MDRLATAGPHGAADEALVRDRGESWRLFCYRRALAATLALCFVSVGAYAQAQTGVSDNVTTMTLTTASGPCLNPNPARRTLMIDNSNYGGQIGYCEMAAVSPGQPGVPCTASVNSANTTVVQAWTAPVLSPAPTNGMCFVNPIGTSTLVLREGQ